jgi:hypothetical protein
VLVIETGIVCAVGQFERSWFTGHENSFLLCYSEYDSAETASGSSYDSTGSAAAVSSYIGVDPVLS